MSTPAGRGRHVDLYQTGVPQPFSVSYGGLEYGGEVVLRDRWDAALGRRLEGDVYFRIVLIRSPRKIPGKEILDSRIAVCIPGHVPSRRREHPQRDLAAIREAQALYSTGRASETASVRGYLERQREELEGRVVSMEAARYAGGYIESPATLSIRVEECFASAEPSTWCRDIAEGLLSWSYPALPIDSTLLPRPVAPEDVPDIYAAMFASSDEARGPLAEFGPALGLSRPDNPLAFDPESTRAFQQIRAALEEHGGELSWEYIQTRLAHASGLTHALGTLYLFAFAYQGDPQTEIVLAPGHGLTLTNGAPVRGGRLTREYVPYLLWRDDLFADKLLSFRVPTERVSWNDALQYTSLLSQGLIEAEDGSPTAASQEQELLGAVRDLRRELSRAQEVLESLARVIPSTHIEAQRPALVRLDVICEGGDFRTIYRLARRGYVDPEQLPRELDLVRLLSYLAESVPEIGEASAYLQGAVVMAGNRQLDVDRMALSEEMALEVLLASPQGWPTVRGHLLDHKARYRRAYLDHHASYQTETGRLRVSLEDSRQRLNSLVLLNSIPELGEPVALYLEQSFDGLERGIRRCNAVPSDMPLDTTPRCVECLMVLGEAPPTEALDRFVTDLDRALGEQNLRLSRVLVERILHDRLDQRLEHFLKIVQAADLSALSNVLSGELAQFIRELLRDP